MQISRKLASLNRRALLLGAAALAFGGPRAFAQAQDFQSFVQSLWPAAQAAGVSREVFDEAAQGLTPEPAVLQKPANSVRIHRVDSRLCRGGRDNEFASRAVARWPAN